jgi:hypothetical protein
MIPSIDSLHKEKSQKENSKNEIYMLVLNKCVEKIVYTNKHTDKTFIIFEVPQVMIGYPTYDMKSCILFLIHKLSKSGYLIEFIDPFYLYIDWATSNQRAVEHSKKINALDLKSKIEFVFEDNLKPKRKGRRRR